MEEISELWEELKFELGSVGIETLPKDKQEIYIGMGNRNADVLFIEMTLNFIYQKIIRLKLNQAENSL